MKNAKWTEFIAAFLLPALLALLGLCLVINPNWAAALVSKILGWALIGCGVISAIVTITGWPVNRVSRVVVTVLLLGVGIFLSRQPLALAANIGKIIGIILVVQGGSGLLDARGAKAMSGITLAAGIFLLLFPLTLSKLVFRICGGVLLVLSISNIVARLRVVKALKEPDDPNIIDAEP